MLYFKEIGKGQIKNQGFERRSSEEVQREEVMSCDLGGLEVCVASEGPREGGEEQQVKQDLDQEPTMNIELGHPAC